MVERVLDESLPEKVPILVHRGVTVALKAIPSICYLLKINRTGEKVWLSLA